MCITRAKTTEKAQVGQNMGKTGSFFEENGAKILRLSRKNTNFRRIIEFRHGELPAKTAKSLISGVCN